MNQVSNLPSLPAFAVALIAIGLVIGLTVVLVIRGIRSSEDPPMLALKLFLTGVLLGTLFFFARRQFGSSTGAMTGDYGLAMTIAGAAAGVGILLTLLWGRDIGELVANPLAA